MIYYYIMEMDLASPEPLESYPTRRRRSWLEFILLLGFALCLLIGLGALGILLWFNATSAPESTHAPLDALRPERVVAELALMELAGDSPQALAFQAINGGYLDTAHAALLYDTTIAPEQRAPLLLQLAQRYQQADDPEQAAQLYRLALAPAILASDLNAAKRSQTLIQIATGLFAVADLTGALDAAIQAKLVAAQMPDLLPAQRSQIFETLQPLARNLDDASFSQQIAELVRNPYLTPAGTLLETRLPTLPETLGTSQAAADAQIVREVAARALTDRIRFFHTSGVAGDLTSDIEPERLTLEQALIAEDQARRAFVENSIAVGNFPLGQQLQLLLEQRRWLAQKLRIASGGYGLSLVPLWEGDRDRIAQELTVATENVSKRIDDFARMGETETANTSLRVEKLYWLALQLELGLYPSSSASQIGEQLRFEQGRLRTPSNPAQPSILLALPIVYDPEQSTFRIQSSN